MSWEIGLRKSAWTSFTTLLFHPVMPLSCRCAKARKNERLTKRTWKMWSRNIVQADSASRRRELTPLTALCEGTIRSFLRILSCTRDAALIKRWEFPYLWQLAIGHVIEPSEQRQAYRLLPILLDSTATLPSGLSGTIIDRSKSVPRKLKDDQMNRLAVHTYSLRPPSQLDLHGSPVRSFGIVNLIRCWQQLQPEGICRNHLSNAAHQMTVRGELPTLKLPFEFRNNTVKLPDQFSDFCEALLVPTFICTPQR